MKKKTSAVIVFNVENPKHFLENYRGLQFLSGSQEWEDILTYYRNGPTGTLSKRLKKEARRKYIYGPISMDGSKAKNPHWKPKVRDSLPYGGSSDMPLMQICLKDDFLAADIIEKSNILVIFFV